MIKEDGATDYTKSNSKDIPKGNYVLNRDKSYCKNNGKIGDYDSVLGKVSFSFIGTDSCYLYFDYEVPSRIGYEAILLDNGGGATTVAEAKAYIEGRTTSTTPNFASTATTNEGMYAKDDDYTATTGMKSYYFRGAINNNWVKFGKYSSDYIRYKGYLSTTGTVYKMYDSMNDCTSATSYNVNCEAVKEASKGDDIYWRIIRINGDGSIRMIYSGTTKPSEDTSVTGSNGVYMTGTGTQISINEFNSSSNKAEYVGYQYILGQQHGYGKCDGTNVSCTVNGNTVYNSKIKQAIENWYVKTTLKDNALISQEQIFCNDRSASSDQSAAWTSTGALYYYGAYGRLDKSKSPQLTCPTASDKFTVNTSNGNGSLTYPVGLITADEVALAGGVKGSNNSSYYLYTNQQYWVGSPSMFTGSYAIEFNVYNYLADNPVNGTDGVRGVVSLSSKAKLSGNGTYNDVYTVVGGNSTEDTSSDKSFDTVFAANNTDIFDEKGIRYEGANPNNYICLDNKTSGACSSSSLLFRIIGLFDEDTSSDGTNSSGSKKLLKVIDTNNYGGTSGKYWNQTQTSGKNYNDWSTATLKTELNDLYLRTLRATSGVNSKLSSAIANAKWHLGGGSSSNYTTLTAEGIYREERNTSAIYSGNPSSIYAQVGLMYPSDYGYATIGGTTTNKSSCRAKELYNWDDESYSDCKNNDWLYRSQSSFVNNKEWLLSPYSSNSSIAAYLFSSGFVNFNGGIVGNSQFAVRPTFYLDSSILKIVGGLGTKDNAYRIG